MVFDPEFAPVQRENGFIKILPAGKFFRVLYVEQLAELPAKDHGTVAAETTLSDQEYTDLYVNDDELAQFRLIPLDDILVGMNQPRAQTRWAGKNATGRLTQFQAPPTWSLRYNLAEIFNFEDDKLFLQITNPTKDAQQRTRVQPLGFRYVLEASQVQPQYVAVPTAGWRQPG